MKVLSGWSDNLDTATRKCDSAPEYIRQAGNFLNNKVEFYSLFKLGALHKYIDHIAYFFDQQYLHSGPWSTHVTLKFDQYKISLLTQILSLWLTEVPS